MITFAGFFIGLIMMVAGFLIIWKTSYMLQWFGDISTLFGAVGARWLSWKIVGVIFLFLGFMIAFGLFQSFFALTLGRLFTIGSI